MNRGRQTAGLISMDAIDDLLTLGKQRCRDTRTQALVSLTRPFPSKLDPIELFTVARRIDDVASYWSLPAKGSWIVGVGNATDITTEGARRFKQAADTIEDLTGSAIIEANNGSGPLFLGGFRFNPDSRMDALWDGFYDGLLTLPRWMIASQVTGQYSYTANLVLNAQSDVEALRKQLAVEAQLLVNKPADSSQPVTAPANREQAVDSWGHRVEQALRAIGEGKLNKVTLARRMKLRSKTVIPPELVLRSLTRSYPECRTFAFCRRGASFVGASPEELVSLSGTNVSSTCLAGTAPRGESETADTELSNWLLKNEKERREHKVVVDWVSERMGALCSKLTWNEVPYVLKLGNVQHLATHFVGTRKDGRHVLDFVEALHPTPAVGGMPLRPALEMIGRLEDFDRGWYTGPVGWVDGNGNGEFAIAIRCALLQGKEAYLYAGDGIVAGSDPDTEDHETMMKFKPLLTALGAL